MKIYVTLIFTVFISFTAVSGKDLAYFRKSFEEIKIYETAQTFLATKITDSNHSNVITINSYKAVCKMMMAQYVYNPFSKYSWFKKGKALLEQTIIIDKNVENVYLRLIVQINVPSFLGYKTNIKSDTEYLLKNLEKATIPKETKEYILANLINTGEVDSLKVLAKKYKVI